MKVLSAIGKVLQCISFLSILLFAAAADSIMEGGNFLMVALIWIGSAIVLMSVGRGLDELG